MNIYVHKNGRRDGPFSSRQVADLVRGGEYSLSDLAWHEGSSEWKPICSITEIVEALMPPLPGESKEHPDPTSPPPIPIQILNNQTQSSLGLQPLLPETNAKDQERQSFAFKCKIVLAVWVASYLIVGMITGSFGFGVFAGSLIFVGLGFFIYIVGSTWDDGKGQAGDTRQNIKPKEEIAVGIVIIMGCLIASMISGFIIYSTDGGHRSPLWFCFLASLGGIGKGMSRTKNGFSILNVKQKEKTKID